MASKQHKNQTAKTPSLKILADIAGDLGFDIADDDLPHYREYVDRLMKRCTTLDHLPEPTLPVKYPRTPGYRPSQEENTHNAWYYKTHIAGSGCGILKDKTVAVKDSVAVAGVPMMYGSTMMEGYMPEYDATLVTRILDAGGIIAGKAVCEDCCSTGTSFTTAYGPVTNPVNTEHSAGGSSSGSAVLVALGEVDMAVGGDQGGSIRIPSSWCGIVGLKPTYGLVPYTGVIEMEQSVDHVGPMARTVKDCALLLQAMSGYDDGLDPRQTPGIKDVDYTHELTGEMGDIKIGILKEGFEVCYPGVAELVRRSANAFFPLGQLEETSIPIHNIGQDIWLVSDYLGTYNTTYLNHGISRGHKGFSSTSFAEHTNKALKSRANDLTPAGKVTMLFGEIHNRFYGSKYYSKSINLGRLLRKAYDDALNKYDVLIMPTMYDTAPKLPKEEIDIKEYFPHACNVQENAAQFNVTGHPTLTINAGYLEGLPVGMLIVGRHHSDITVLNVALAFETARDSADE